MRGKEMNFCGVPEMSVMLAILLLVTPLAAAAAVGSSMPDDHGDDAEAGKGWPRGEREVKWLYDEWMLEHDKSYADPEERENRFKIFSDNLRFIDEHNRPENNHTYTVGLNEFADLTDEEYRSLYLNAAIRNTSISSEGGSPAGVIAGSLRKPKRSDERLPSSVDWRRVGAVSRVKHQGKCGSCRAFATVAAVESLHKIVHGKLITLSEQEVIDCDEQNDGCNAGVLRYAYLYIIDNGGIDTDRHYPYRGVKGVCKADRVRAVRISTFVIAPSNNALALKKSVAKQPVSVHIEAKSRGFRFLRTGVFVGPCGSDVDHAVAVVGYGRERGVDFWLVKNSWGVGWGDGGFGKIQRNVGGEGRCGILVESMFPKMGRRLSSDLGGKKFDA